MFVGSMVEALSIPGSNTFAALVWEYKPNFILAIFIFSLGLVFFRVAWNSRYNEGKKPWWI
ncbi:MAG: hypothetical protein AAB445_00925 [Patescibacteria group bacterium]